MLGFFCLIIFREAFKFGIWNLGFGIWDLEF